MRPELVIGKHSYFWYDAMLEAIVAINILFHDDCRMLVISIHCTFWDHSHFFLSCEAVSSALVTHLCSHFLFGLLGNLRATSCQVT